jgi:alpha-N-arabinofuranosidase
VFSGMTLDIFNRHPEKVAIGCCAQLVNCLNSLYLAHEDKFCVTPVGHVFAMYAAHQGGQSVRAEFSAPSVHYDRDGQQASFWGLHGSASLHNKELVITAVNPSAKDALDAQIAIRGARVKSGTAIVLTAPDIHALNTFDQREAVKPRSEQLDLKADMPVFHFPAASVVTLTLELA